MFMQYTLSLTLSTTLNHNTDFLHALLVGDLAKEIITGGPVPSFPKLFKGLSRLEKEKELIELNQRKAQAARERTAQKSQEQHFLVFASVYIHVFLWCFPQTPSFAPMYMCDSPILQ